MVNLETKEKSHKPGTAPLCPNDGWVIFRNSELLAGRLGKSTLGGGNKAGLFQVCIDCKAELGNAERRTLPAYLHRQSIPLDLLACGRFSLTAWTQ